jgi:hypothetical protein
MTRLTFVMLGGGLGLLATSLFSSSVLANTPEKPTPRTETLRVYPFPDIAQSKCPKEVKVTIQPSPYRPGSFDSTGKVQLSAIADTVEFESSDRFSVTWRARIKLQYRSCIGSAGLVETPDRRVSQSLLRMRFVNGNVYFMVDTTGLSDANGYTLSIIRQNIEAGNPTWRYGGTD